MKYLVINVRQRGVFPFTEIPPRLHPVTEGPRFGTDLSNSQVVHNRLLDFLLLEYLLQSTPKETRWNVSKRVSEGFTEVKTRLRNSTRRLSLHPKKVEFRIRTRVMKGLRKTVDPENCLYSVRSLSIKVWVKNLFPVGVL